jgi:hypothetical protein
VIDREVFERLYGQFIAGRDAAGVLQAAVAARSLHDARNIARVLDSRVRRMLSPHAALPAR